MGSPKKPAAALQVSKRLFLLLANLALVFSLPLVCARLALAQNFTTPASKASSLDVRYDPNSDLLSVRADQRSLGEVLHEISRIAHVSIDAPDEALLSEKLSIEMKGLSMEQGLRQLLRGLNSAFVYSAAVDPQGGPSRSRLVKVILASGKASTPTLEHQPGIALRPAASPETALLRAVIDNDSLSAKALVQPLSEPGREREREQAVESLLETLTDKNFPSHYDAITALDELAPEKARAALANLLQGDDQEMRVIAATGLGQVGNELAIPPLMSALNGDDPLTRQIAANSLARIGGERATDALFTAYLAGDPGVKQAVAGAVAFHADEKSQIVLANVIAGGPVPAGKTPQEVVASTIPFKEGYASKLED